MSEPQQYPHYSMVIEWSDEDNLFIQVGHERELEDPPWCRN